MYRQRIRKRLAMAVAVVAVLLVAGSAFGRFPIPGEEWAEWTNLDSAGNVVGGGRIECDGTMRTWGDSGRPTGMTLYPCY